MADLYTPVSSNWGYRIIPKTGVNTSAFSPSEVYQFMSDWYANQWDAAMANVFWNIAKDLGNYSKFANSTASSADALLNYIRGNEQWLQSVAWKLYWNLVSDIQSQRDYINQMFGPSWELTKEVNTYYDDLWNYLATEAWRQAAKIAAQWIHSWASLWAIRAQQNEAYNEAFWRYVQAKEQQINAKQQIASNLINYMSTLRQEYGDTTNQYVIDLYKRANDLYNSIASSVAEDMIEYNNLRIPGKTSSNTSWYSYDIYWNLIDSDGKIVKTWKELQQENQTNNNENSAYGPYTRQRYPELLQEKANSVRGSNYVILHNNNN